jgi:hypothetical protein
MTIHRERTRAFRRRQWAILIGMVSLVAVIIATDYFGLKG